MKLFIHIDLHNAIKEHICCPEIMIGLMIMPDNIRLEWNKAMYYKKLTTVDEVIDFLDARDLLPSEPMF